jgi:hypothetical protein
MQLLLTWLNKESPFCCLCTQSKPKSRMSGLQIRALLNKLRSTRDSPRGREALLTIYSSRMAPLGEACRQPWRPDFTRTCDG